MSKRVGIHRFFGLTLLMLGMLLPSMLLVNGYAQAQALLNKPILSESQSRPLVNKELEQRVFSRLKQARPELTFSDLQNSPISGVYKLKVNGQVAFVSHDGSYLIAGEMYEVRPGNLVNLQEQDRQRAEKAFAPQRAQMLNQIKPENMVVYSPKKDLKGSVYIFTDIDCGFCRRLHSQMEGFMKKGIEVRYLAFPRAGPNSDSAKKLATVWCADNPRRVMDRFKKGDNVALAPCKQAPILQQYTLGQKVGVRGTPAIVTASGQLIPGAVSPDYLAEVMGI